MLNEALTTPSIVVLYAYASTIGLWPPLTLYELNVFRFGIISCLCNLIELYIFHWHDCLFMFANVVVVNLLHMRKILHCLMQLFCLCTIQCRLIMQVDPNHRFFHPILTKNLLRRLPETIDCVCKFTIYSCFLLTWIPTLAMCTIDAQPLLFCFAKKKEFSSVP